LDEAFDWLGPEIVLAHAKNPPGIEKAFDVAEAETGIRAWEGPLSGKKEEHLAKLPTEEGRQEFRLRNAFAMFYRPYLTSLTNAGFRGALIMHGLEEGDVELRASFLRETLESLSTKD
jgi:hypothetical protein